jgi:hypothetical protein
VTKSRVVTMGGSTVQMHQLSHQNWRSEHIHTVNCLIRNGDETSKKLSSRISGYPFTSLLSIKSSSSKNLKVLVISRMCGILVSARVCSVDGKEEVFEKRNLELEEMNSSRGMCSCN